MYKLSILVETINKKVAPIVIIIIIFIKGNFLTISNGTIRNITKIQQFTQHVELQDYKYNLR